jgi:hypothetical protein
MADYSVHVDTVSLQTEGGGVVHPNSEVYDTERLACSVLVTNLAPNETGLLSVSWLLDGSEVMGETHAGIQALGSEWLRYRDYLTIPAGHHEVAVQVTPEDTTLVNGGSSTIAFNVVPNPHHRAMPEGKEAYHEGWAQADVHIRIDNWQGHAIQTGEAVIQFSGHGGETSGERGAIEDGLLTYDQLWVPSGQGTVRLWVTLPEGTVNQLHGTADTTLADGVIRLAFTQDHTRETMSHSEAKTRADKLGGKVSGGLDFKIWKAGAEVSYEHLWQSTDTDTETYEIWIAQPTLHWRGDLTPGQR